MRVPDLRLPHERLAARQHGVHVELERTEDHDEVAGGDRAVMDHVRLVDTVDRCRSSSDGAVGADNGPGEERCGHVVPEDDQLAGGGVDLGVGGDPGGEPSGEVVPAEGVQLRADLVGRGALGEGEEVAGVADDVDVGVELEGPRRVRIVAEERLVDERRGHQPAEERLAGALLGEQALRAHQPVGVAGLAGFEPHAVQHPVTLQRIRVRAERRELWVGAVAQVRAGQIVGQRAVDGEVVDVDLVVHRGVAAGQERLGGLIEGGERGHGDLSSAVGWGWCVACGRRAGWQSAVPAVAVAGR